MRLIELPFAYTYLSRLRNERAAVGYVAREWIPLIVALQIAYTAAWWLSTVMLLSFLSLYECGYLVNDLSESASEPGGNRIRGLRINILRFWIGHTFVFALAAGLLWVIRGPRCAILFSGLGILVLGILLLHSNRFTRQVRSLRIATFTILAVYKFAPIVLPLVSWSDGQSLLIAVFLCYGFPRVIVYILRKFGEAEAQATLQESFRGLEFAGLIAFAPILITTRLEARDAMAVALIVVLYAVIYISFFGLNLIRVKISKQAEQAY